MSNVTTKALGKAGKSDETMLDGTGIGTRESETAASGGTPSNVELSFPLLNSPLLPKAI